MAGTYHHIIPQVYLREFGYQKFNNRFFVSVYNIKAKKWESRDIRKFLGESNFYLIDDIRFGNKHILERTLHGQIETRLPLILRQLKDEVNLTENIQFAIAETTANFLCRNRMVINWLPGWNENGKLLEFYKWMKKKELKPEILAFLTKISTMSKKDFAKVVMIDFMDYVSRTLNQMSMEIIVGNDEMPFFTSENPVILRNIDGLGYLERSDAEIYFPISKHLLIKFYWQDISLELSRNYIVFNQEQTDFFNQDVLLSFASEYIIAPEDHTKHDT